MVNTINAVLSSSAEGAQTPYDFSLILIYHKSLFAPNVFDYNIKTFLFLKFQHFNTKCIYLFP